MRDIIHTLIAAVLFFVLTPGVFLRFPKNESLVKVAGVHAVIFGIVWLLWHKLYKIQEGAVVATQNHITTDGSGNIRGTSTPARTTQGCYIKQLQSNGSVAGNLFQPSDKCKTYPKCSDLPNNSPTPDKRNCTK
jgi:hypothetical protein